LLGAEKQNRRNPLTGFTKLVHAPFRLAGLIFSAKPVSHTYLSVLQIFFQYLAALCSALPFFRCSFGKKGLQVFA